MVLENFCKNCGKRILPSDRFCPNCGSKTMNESDVNDFIFTVPIHDIGFFNFSIDFSPYIERNGIDFKYELCACGYLNDKRDEFCYMCGSKRSVGRISKFLKVDSRSKFSIDTIMCECGHLNSKENVFCEMCGKQFSEGNFEYYENNSNFNSEFREPVFCFCGEENDKFSLFCHNCGRPLKNYGKSDAVRKLCSCSTFNDVSSDFCIYCGSNIKYENTRLICVCGQANDGDSKFCSSCKRPLNPKRVIKSKIVCDCGEILDYGVEFCHNCGKNIKMIVQGDSSDKVTYKSLKERFRQG